MKCAKLYIPDFDDLTKDKSLQSVTYNNKSWNTNTKLELTKITCRILIYTVQSLYLMSEDVYSIQKSEHHKGFS